MVTEKTDIMNGLAGGCKSVHGPVGDVYGRPFIHDNGQFIKWKKHTVVKEEVPPLMDRVSLNIRLRTAPPNNSEIISTISGSSVTRLLTSRPPNEIAFLLSLQSCSFHLNKNLENL